jgi:hypothetical protein
MTKLFSFAFVLILLVGCVGTPYQRKGATGGYSETRLGENVFKEAAEKVPFQAASDRGGV